MATQQPGLRERKRLERRRAIQLAALSATDRLGLVAATVEEISRIADIAPRTFFNHFASKEEALLGEESLPLSPEVIRDFVASEEPIVEDLYRLLTSVVEITHLDLELVRRRQQLAIKYPELAGRRAAWMSHLQDDLCVAITQRLSAERPELSERDRSEQALLLASMSVATFTSAWQWWMDHGTSTSLSLLDDIERAFESWRRY